MQEILQGLIPNVMEKLPVFYKSILETLLMTGWSGSIAFVLGAVLGVGITVTRQGAILQNAVVY